MRRCGQLVGRTNRSMSDLPDIQNPSCTARANNIQTWCRVERVVICAVGHDIAMSKRNSSVWGWGIAGAVALPLLVLPQYVTSPTLVRLSWVVVGLAIGASAAATARARGEASWKIAALSWSAAYGVGATVYWLWPEYAEPLANPGDVNYVILPPQTSVQWGGILISPSQWHAIWRTVVTLVLSVAIGASVNGARLAPSGRKVEAAIVSVVAWVLGVAIAIALALFVGVYAVHFLAKAFVPPAQPVGIALGTILVGAVCGTVAGAIGEGALNRYVRSQV
jgi:hypothetical protein